MSSPPMSFTQSVDNSWCLRVPWFAEVSRSNIKTVTSVSIMQSGGGCLRIPRLAEVGQATAKMRFLRRDVPEQAPERLNGEGRGVKLRYKQISTSTIYFSSDYHEMKMPMIAVEFLTNSVCQIVHKESSYNPMFEFNFKENVKEDAEVFNDKSKREGAALGWI